MTRTAELSANIAPSLLIRTNIRCASREVPFAHSPLHYYHHKNLAAAASVPRAIFAAGVQQRLNHRRVGDSAIFNFTNVEESWFEGISRVPLGSIVTLRPGQPRVLREYYDPTDIPKVRLESDAAYIRRTSELLDEGVRACLAGFSRPGVTLSGGLDFPASGGPRSRQPSLHAETAHLHIPSIGRL